jgi:cutinase
VTFLGGSTENGVTSNSGCKELTFIFARGTGELGNMGTVVGPEVAAQLKTLTSDKVTIQGVTYPADAAVSEMQVRGRSRWD